MELQDIPFHRLHAQNISYPKFKKPQQIVSHLGVMQAQDFYMVKWALGIRLPGTKSKEIEKAMDKGDILRTHLLRPTWHLVSSDDIHWLLDLTAPHLKALLKTRHKELELTEAIMDKSLKIIEKVLSKQKQATREELVTELETQRSIPKENRASHLLFRAEIEGLICSGTGMPKTLPMPCWDDRVLKPKPIPKQEALAKLMLTYFKSRGPATMKDFLNWSSLSNTEAKQGWEMVKDKLTTAKIGDLEYAWDDSLKVSKKEKEEIYLLPAFDEYIIGYKDRTAVLADNHYKTAVSINGIFWPTIVDNGQVVGIWKRNLTKDKVLVEPIFSNLLLQRRKRKRRRRLQRLVIFLDVKVEMEHKKST